MRIQNQHDDPDQHRAELLQETDGRAIEVALARHRRMHAGAQYPRQEHGQQHEHEKVNQRTPQRIRPQEGQNIALAQLDVLDDGGVFHCATRSVGGMYFSQSSMRTQRDWKLSLRIDFICASRVICVSNSTSFLAASARQRSAGAVVSGEPLSKGTVSFTVNPASKASKIIRILPSTFESYIRRFEMRAGGGNSPTLS